MLPKVSRTFALCIRLLPAELEYPVLIAYLLCRIADTIEDRPDLTGGEKRRLLDAFGETVEGGDAGAVRDAFAHPRSAEEHLAHHVGIVRSEFNALPANQQRCIRPHVIEMCDGMATFAERQPDGATELAGLDTVEELDAYCYFVAGTVGHLLTDLYCELRPAMAHRRDILHGLATSFGLGLQLTNIIKDVGDDNLRGWSFVPRSLCAQAGITPQQLQDTAHVGAARSVMLTLIHKAEHHLRDALAYCANIPRRQYRIRMFCLTSMYFAIRTLSLAGRDRDLLSPSHKVKISRDAVYRTVGATALVAPSNHLIRAYYRYLRIPELAVSPPFVSLSP